MYRADVEYLKPKPTDKNKRKEIAKIMAKIINELPPKEREKKLKELSKILEL